MFTFGRKQKEMVSMSSQQDQNASDTIWLSGVEVRTMPDKFLHATRTHPASAGSRKMLWVWISLGIILTGFVGVAAFFYFSTPPQQPPPSDASFSESETDSQPPSLEDIPPAPPVTTIDEEEPEAPPLPDQSEFLSPTTTPETPSEEPAEENTLPSDEEVIPPGPTGQGVDTDGDGLTDLEENLFGTAAVVADSDADGYPDGSELQGFYDPRKGGGARLRDSTYVSEFANSLQGYAVLYPSAWTVSPLDSGQADVVFTASTGESFEVLAQQNTTGFSDPSQWFASTFPDISLETAQLVTFHSGLSGIKTLDGTRAYIVTPGTVYFLTYQASLAQYWQYLTTFSVFADSLTLSAQ